MSNIELKPCPFCGGKAELDVSEVDLNGSATKDVFQYSCIACDTCSHEFDDVEDAAKAWNTRAPQSERIKELEQSLFSMTHVAKELYGTISEYSLMPCKSLETRMISTANRYATRIFGDTK